jgi:hypothetical protein
LVASKVLPSTDRRRRRRLLRWSARVVDSGIYGSNVRHFATVLRPSPHPRPLRLDLTFGHEIHSFVHQDSVRWTVARISSRRWNFVKFSRNSIHSKTRFFQFFLQNQLARMQKFAQKKITCATYQFIFSWKTLGEFQHQQILRKILSKFPFFLFKHSPIFRKIELF